MDIEFCYFPGGVRRALTMSFDDGKTADIRLAQLFTKYGIKGTFHYNSANIGKDTYVTEADIKEIAVNHEISAHSRTHPFMDRIPLPFAIEEIADDRKSLEAISGQIVRGMSYPYGAWTQPLIAALRAVGMEYSRTIQNTKSLDLPHDFMEWHPTCHQSHDLDHYWEKLMKSNKHIRLLYIWGHSYEFDRDNSWQRIEEFCKKAGCHQEVWYATNIEIKEYVTAMRSLVFSMDKKTVYNPSSLPVWFSADRETVKVESGQTLRL